LSYRNYVALTSAVDWFFVHERVGGSVPVVWRLACWGAREDGGAVGLIGAGGELQGGNGVAPVLVEVPPVPGAYLHLSQLSDEEKQASNSR
jgi:hypothetical protein